ncbi:unnamed protein product, partial [Prorocentrum cordatum]
ARTAPRTAFTGVPPEKLAQAARGVEEERGESEIPPPPEPVRDMGAEDDAPQEIGAIAQAAEPFVESDAADILTTRKQTRIAMNEERLDRGLRPEQVRRQVGAGGQTRQYVDNLGRRAKYFRSKIAGHFGRDCKEPLPAQGSQMVLAARVETDCEEGLAQAAQDVGGPSEQTQVAAELAFDDEISSSLKVSEDNALAKLIRGERWKRLEHGRCKYLIGAEALAKHGAATGQMARWLKDLEQMRFRGFDNSVRGSIVARASSTGRSRHAVICAAQAAPGPAGSLMGKPNLKALGARIDFETDSARLTQLDLAIPRNETAGTMVAEMFPQPRIVPVAVKAWVKDGKTLDKVSGWDVSKADDYDAIS